MCFLLSFLCFFSPILQKTFTDFDGELVDVGIPFSQQTQRLENPFALTETPMKYSWIYDSFFQGISPSAIIITKNTDFMAKIEKSTFLSCSSSSNGGAISISAYNGGRLWLQYVCGNGCSANQNGHFLYLELKNFSSFLVSSHRCSGAQSGDSSVHIRCWGDLFVENFNSSNSFAERGAAISFSDTSDNAFVKYVSFENDASSTGSPIIFSDSSVTFYYANILGLRSTSSSIVSLSGTTSITFDHTYFAMLNFNGFMITGPAATSEVEFIDCAFPGVVQIATADVTTKTETTGAPPIETYFIQHFGTENCFMLYPYPTRTLTPEVIEESIIDEWPWWYWLLLALALLLLIFLLWYLFILCCPVCLCCPCCDCCRCMFGQGQCRYPHCLCDVRCGYCRCCKKTSQCEDYDPIDLESDSELLNKKQFEESSSEDDTDKIISNAAKSQRGSNKKVTKTTVIHMQHAINQLSNDKKNLTKELNERNNIISRQMQQMEQMESDLDNNDDLNDDIEEDECDDEDKKETDKKEKQIPIKQKQRISNDEDEDNIESDDDSVNPNVSSDDSNPQKSEQQNVHGAKPGPESRSHVALISHNNGNLKKGKGNLSTSTFQGVPYSTHDIPMSYADPMKRFRNGRNVFPGVDVFSAVMTNSYDELAVIIRKNPSLVNKRNRLGCTPLYIAAQRGNLQLCKMLIDLGADLNQPNKYGHSPLHRAACNGHLNVCKLLVSKGCIIDSRTNWGFTPLDRAIQKNQPAVAQYLISQGASLYAKDNFGNMPFHRVAKHGRSDLIAMFMSAGFDVNARGCDGMTALHFASEGGFLKTAEVLISYGADPNIKSNDGRLAVDVATNDQMLRYLLSLHN